VTVRAGYGSPGCNPQPAGITVSRCGAETGKGAGHVQRAGDQQHRAPPPSWRSGPTRRPPRRSCGAVSLMAMRAVGTPSSRARGAGRDGFSRAGRHGGKADLAAALSNGSGALSPQISRTPVSSRSPRLLTSTAARGGSWACKAPPEPTTASARGTTTGVRAALLPPPRRSCRARQRHGKLIQSSETMLPTKPDQRRLRGPVAASKQHQAETEGIAAAAATWRAELHRPLLLRPRGARWRRRSSGPLLPRSWPGLLQVRWLGAMQQAAWARLHRTGCRPPEASSSASSVSTG